MQSKNQDSNNLKSALLPIAIIIALVIGYFTIDVNTLYQSFKGEAQFVTQDKNVDLHKSSSIIKIQDGTTFELEIFPKTIPLMEEIKFTVKSNNHNLENINLNIYATNMFMGDLNLPLKNLGNGNYEASGILPTCPTGDMLWNAEIRVEKIDITIGARFQFKTDK